ncbi:ribosomal protein S5 domain 2-type protein [Schizophyllum fasciatum]
MTGHYRGARPVGRLLRYDACSDQPAPGSRIEILNAHGYRSDGRKQYELRDMTIDLSPRASADGSALVTHGLTQVLVSVYGPREPKQRSQSAHDRATINVEVGTAPFSSGERRKRGRGDKRVQELCYTVQQTFEPVVLAAIYPRSTIDIFVTVLQQDGSLIPACINATTMALVCAGVPLLDFVCAVSAGVHDTHAMLDLTTLEENDLPWVNVAVMPKTAKVVMVGLETRLHVQRFEEMFRIALDASKVLHAEMKAAIQDRTSRLTLAMSAVRGPGQKPADDDMME